MGGGLIREGGLFHFLTGEGGLFERGLNREITVVRFFQLRNKRR